MCIRDRNRIKYQSEIDDGRRELEEGRVQLEDGRRNYLEYYEAWLKGLREYNEREVQLNDAKSQLDRAGLELEQGEEVLAQAKAELDQGKAQLDLLDQGIVALENLRGQLSEQAPGDQEEFNRLVAVSYTHLDVYKRQKLSEQKGNSQGFFNSLSSL